MSMGVPGDAFSLSTGRHSLKRRSSRPTTARSPSPKIPFGPQLPIQMPGAVARDGSQQLKLVRRRSSRDAAPLLRQASYHSPPPTSPLSNGHAHANGHATHPLEEIGEDAHSGNGALHAPAGKPKKIDWEIPRKTFHSSIGLMVLPLYINRLPVQPIVVTLTAFLAYVVAMDVLRFSSPAIERQYERVVGFLMRESEKTKVNGVVWYLVGVLFVLYLLPLDIAIVSILLLSWADTAASTFGRLYGPRTAPLPPTLHLLTPLVFILPSSWQARFLSTPPFKWLYSALVIPFAPRKSVAGFTAATITGAIVSSAFWGFLAPVGVDSPSWAWGVRPLGNGLGLVLVATVTGLVAGLAEALNVGPVDDNLSLPVIAGVGLWAFFRLVAMLA